MRLESSIIVNHQKEQVWNFLKEPSNLAKWDVNITKVVSTSTDPIGVGYTFETISSEQPGQKKGLRMSYRIIEYVPLQYAKILLVRSGIFKKAVWTMSVESSGNGTKVCCEVNLTFRFKYFYLIPIILFSKRGKLLTSLEHFEGAMGSS